MQAKDFRECSYNFSKEKEGDGKIFWRQEGETQNVLDAIKRLSIIL